MIVTRKRRRRRRRRRVQGEHRVKSQLASHPSTKQQPVSVGGTRGRSRGGAGGRGGGGGWLRGQKSRKVFI